MSTFLWILLVAQYLAALISLGVATLRKGHTVLFVVGPFLPRSCGSSARSGDRRPEPPARPDGSRRRRGRRPGDTGRGTQVRGRIPLVPQG